MRSTMHLDARRGVDGCRLTSRRRAKRHEAVTVEDQAILADTYTDLNPAAIQRRIQALTTNS